MLELWSYTSRTKMVQFKLGTFVVSFDEATIEHETYDDKCYYGIIFKDQEAKYDLIHHRIDWTRMIVNYKDGSYKDLPFHEGTFRFLPDCVKVERIV
jgi:hypothetical protein